MASTRTILRPMTLIGALICAAVWADRIRAATETSSGAATSPAIRIGSRAILIGSRLELFVDHCLIDTLDRARLELGQPRPAEVSLTFDRPWEGVAVGYVTVIHDANIYRMYYRGLPTSDAPDGSDFETTCYAESLDGVKWTRPNLKLYEVNGTRDNNVILAHQPPSAHNFSPMLDTHPKCDPAQKYKALTLGPAGLLAYASPDGIHWKKVQDAPVLTSKDFAFDSQNVAFYSTVEGCYICYFRTWRNGVRWISRSTSTDFLRWSQTEDMTYGDTPHEHLYTNQTHPYFRAPHLYIATAARFMPGRRVLTDAELHQLEVSPSSWLKDDCSEVVLLTSRGGNKYDRTFMEAFIRPGLGASNWVSRSNYPALNVVQTGPDEMSMYVQRDNGQKSHHMLRYTLRLDGFASVRAPYGGGEMITKPLNFDVPPKAAPLAGPPAVVAPAGPVDIDKAAPLFGRQSLRFKEPAVLELPGTQKLGDSATFSVHLKNVPAGHRRLFSAYDGGPIGQGEFVFDFNSGGAIVEGAAIQFMYGDGRIAASTADVGDWSLERGDGKMHHIAATFKAGDVIIYFDGRPVGSGKIPSAGRLEFSLGDLRLGEDYPPTWLNNEPLLGMVDDVLVLRRALSADEIKALSSRGAETLAQETEQGILYTMENTSGDVLGDSLAADGAQDSPLPGGLVPAEVQLLLNYSTSAAGGIRCELQDSSGKPMPGYSLSDCDEIIGDRISHAVSWKGRSELKALASRAIRVRFNMRDADIYSMRFGR